MSKDSSRLPQTVVWDSTTRLWTKKPQQDGFFELLEPFSGTWPISGSMRNGVAWPHPTSAPRTAGTASSSSPGPLLPTPTATNPNDGESLESWEARRQRNLAKGINGNGQGTPLGIAVRLLPTPRTSYTNGAGTHGDGGMDLRTAVSLLPTPMTSDGERTSSAYGRGNPTLTGAITHLRSSAGRKHSAAPPPGQLTFGDD